jgi:nucleotide-binding universal stress UspA family protein
MQRRILVALDESDASRRVAEFVNSFFRDLGVEVLALNVARLPVSWFSTAGYGMIEPYAWADFASMDETVDAAKQQAQEAIEASGIENDEALVEVGDPVDMIRTAATNHKVDLIVVGAHDKGRWLRLLEGSVSDELVHNSQCPVLVVH